MNRIFATSVVFVIAAGSVFAQTQGSPESFKGEAFNKIKLASSLVNRAQEFIKSGLSRENLQSAIALYIEAGKLFEESAAILTNLGPNYVTQEDIDGCTLAVTDCVNAIKQCNNLLMQLEQQTKR